MIIVEIQAVSTEFVGNLGAAYPAKLTQIARDFSCVVDMPLYHVFDL